MISASSRQQRFRSWPSGARLLTTAPRASDIEAVNGDIEILFIRRFFPRVELPSFVDIFATRHTYMVVSSLASDTWWRKEDAHFMEKGAMRRTVITFGPAFLGTRDLAILEGSKSGG